MSNLKEYLKGGTKESLMRLMSFIMVLTGCGGVICAVIISFYQLFFKQAIDWSGLSLFVGSCGSFCGIGLAGKYYQKRVENGGYGNYNNYGNQGYQGYQSQARPIGSNTIINTQQTTERHILLD